MNGPLFKKSANNRLRPGRHGGDASTSVSLRFERFEILLCCGGHLCLRDVGLKGWIAEHTDIDRYCAQARALNLFAQEGEFFPLGVERADQRNGLNNHRINFSRVSPGASTLHSGIARRIASGPGGE